MNHTIKIEKIIHGGLGLGRLESGIVVLTRYVLEGEEVVVKEIKKKRGYIEAETVKILQASPDREKPPCPYYMQCGGCNMQHMNLATQHRAKENILRESLNRAKVPVADNTIYPIISSPVDFHYRHRIRLKVSPQGEIGFHSIGTNTIIDIEYCHVATEILNKALNELRSSEFLASIAQGCREIELLQSPSSKRIFCIIHPHRGISLPKEKLKDATLLKTISTVAIKQGRTVLQQKQEEETTLLSQQFDASICTIPYELSWSSGCFYQVNAKQNETLVRLSCQLAGDSNGKKVLDLYCGTGNFSIPFALQGAFVTGVERHTKCIEHAIGNASESGLDSTSFFDIDVHKWLRKAVKRSKKFDTILLDPPRQGMGKDIILLSDLSPAKIIYISCDPATISRDLSLLAANGYSITSITPVDMFPQTHHIESVTLLEKN